MNNLYLEEDVEKQLIFALIDNPSRYFDFNLRPHYFTSWDRVAIMELIEKSIVDTGTFHKASLLTLEAKFKISQYFQDGFLQIHLLPNYLSACESVVKKYVQRELSKLLGGEATPEQVRERADELMKEGSQKKYLTLSETLKQYSENYKLLQDRKKLGFGVGIQTTWPKFNQQTGLRHGDLMIVGARPSIGKTAFGINLAMEAAFSGQGVLFASAEMGVQSLTDRFLALASKSNMSSFRYGSAQLNQFLPQLETYKDQLSFMFEPKMTSMDILTTATKQNQLDLVIVDYLQLLGDDMQKGETENNRVARISRNLKQLSNQKNCAVVALAQLNRGSEKEKREPRLSDLRDSGSIEQDADIVLLLHRESREDTDVLVRVAKNRNGQTGELNFVFNLQRGEFIETDSPITS